MKNFNIFKVTTWVLAIALVSVLFSCNTSMDFAKRRYSSGYYVNLGGKHNGTKQQGTEVSSAKKVKHVKHDNFVPALPASETVTAAVAFNELPSNAIFTAVDDNTLTASTDAAPMVFANQPGFTSHLDFPVANINHTYVSANTSAKKDANSNQSSNHKGWYIFGGVAAFLGTLGLAAFGAKKRGGGNDKDWMITVLLCFFLGGLGLHRFYLGYTWQGVVQLLTGGGCGIWALIDFIRILMKDLKPLDGDYR